MVVLSLQKWQEGKSQRTRLFKPLLFPTCCQLEYSAKQVTWSSPDSKAGENSPTSRWNSAHCKGANAGGRLCSHVHNVPQRCFLQWSTLPLMVHGRYLTVYYSSLSMAQFICKIQVFDISTGRQSIHCVYIST